MKVIVLLVSILTLSQISVSVNSHLTGFVTRSGTSLLKEKLSFLLL